MDQREAHLSQDVVFDILSSPRRRYVLYYLRTTDGPIKLTDLAEQVAAWENETSPAEITEQERKRVYVSLYQTHIPRLDEAGIVEYDKDSGNIVLVEDAAGIDDYLSTPEDSIPWQRIYLAIAGVGLLFLGAIALEIAVFATIPETVAAAIVVTAFLITAVVHSAVRLTQKRSIPPELQDKR